MAMTACEAKVSISLICLSVKGLTSVRRMPIRPIGVPSRSNGVASTVRTHANRGSLRYPGTLSASASTSGMWTVFAVMMAAVETMRWRTRASATFQGELSRSGPPGTKIFLDKSNGCVIGPAHPSRTLTICPAPVGYRSASWRSHPRFHSSPFAAPTIP